MSDLEHRPSSSQETNPGIAESPAELKANYARPSVIPPEANKDKTRRIGHLPLMMGGAAVAIGAVAGGYFATRGGEKQSTEPVNPESSTSASVVPGETQSPPEEALTPEQAIGKEQTTYENVNTPEAANKPEFLERARQPISTDTPLEEATVIMGQKLNIYTLTGDEETLTSIFGSDRTDGTADSQYSAVVERVKRLHGHSNDRFSYFIEGGYSPEQIIDVNTGEQVQVTEHDSFEPIMRSGQLSMKAIDHHYTNFEDVDRDEVFTNDVLDNSYSNEVEIIFREVDGEIFIDDIRPSS